MVNGRNNDYDKKIIENIEFALKIPALNAVLKFQVMIQQSRA